MEAVSATDGETTSSGATLVKGTPLDKIECKIARAPGSLDVKSLVGKISRIRFSSCACELAYVMATFWLAYFWYLQAKERGDDTAIHEQRLLQWLSAFNMHYSRAYAVLETPWPLLAGMRSLTPRRSAKGYTLSRRPGLDIVRSQKALDRSFCAKYFCPDRCANQVSQTPSTPSTRPLVDDVAARVSRQSF
jgi:hypothetical protein